VRLQAAPLDPACGSQKDCFTGSIESCQALQCGQPSKLFAGDRLTHSSGERCSRFFSSETEWSHQRRWAQPLYGFSDALIDCVE
jgi:hypothetical protein